MDYPAGVLPTGTFVGLEDVREPEREFLSEQDREVWAACELRSLGLRLSYEWLTE